MSLARGTLAATLMAEIFLAGATARADLPNKQECVAANEEAQHLKHTHKWVEAKRRLLDCVAPSCPGAIREDCLDMLSVIQKAMPTVVFVTQDPSGADVTALSVTMDGMPLAAEVGTTALEVDPGDHTFSVVSDGYAGATQTVRIKPGERNRPIRTILRPLAEPSLALEDASKTPEVGPPAPGRAPPTTQLADVDARVDGTGGQRRAAFLVLGVGGAGLAIGTVFGLATLQRQFLIDSDCPRGRCPSSIQAEMGNRNTDALACDLSLAVGVVGLGLGAALLLFSHDGGAIRPAAPAATVVATPWIGLDSVGMRGSFR